MHGIEKVLLTLYIIFFKSTFKHFLHDFKKKSMFMHFIHQLPCKKNPLSQNPGSALDIHLDNRTTLVSTYMEKK